MIGNAYTKYQWIWKFERIKIENICQDLTGTCNDNKCKCLWRLTEDAWHFTEYEVITIEGYGTYDVRNYF